MLSESALIAFLSQHTLPQRQDVNLGIGDDCALLTIPPGKQLAVTMDSFIAGTHFPEHTSAFDIGYKAMAVNLSDLAAMGAEPAWVTISLSTPHLESPWVEDLVAGLTTLTKKYNVALVGGDTCRGPLMITVQAHGFVDDKKALFRHQAQAGDTIYVTGTLGDGAVGLAAMQSRLAHSLNKADLAFCQQRLNQPTPRVALGQALVGVANSMIDLSDGLYKDLGHIAQRSGLGAEIDATALPLSLALRTLPSDQAWQFALRGGDDYELCFTASVSHASIISELAVDHGIAITAVGHMTAEHKELKIKGTQGGAIKLAKGFEHF